MALTVPSTWYRKSRLVFICFQLLLQVEGWLAVVFLSVSLTAMMSSVSTWTNTLSIAEASAQIFCPPLFLNGFFFVIVKF